MFCVNNVNICYIFVFVCYQTEATEKENNEGLRNEGDHYFAICLIHDGTGLTTPFIKNTLIKLF